MKNENSLRQKNLIPQSRLCCYLAAAQPNNIPPLSQGHKYDKNEPQPDGSLLKKHFAPQRTMKKPAFWQLRLLLRICAKGLIKISPHFFPSPGGVRLCSLLQRASLSSVISA